MNDDYIKRLREHLDSPEGKESMRLYAKKLADAESIRINRLEKFHTKYKDNLPEIIKILDDKYSSKAYRKKYWDKHQEPAEDLYWVLLDYCNRYSKPVSELVFNIAANDFTSEMYQIDNYLISRMDGQGSVVKVEEISEELSNKIKLAEEEDCDYIDLIFMLADNGYKYNFKRESKSLEELKQIAKDRNLSLIEWRKSDTYIKLV